MSNYPETTNSTSVAVATNQEITTSAVHIQDNNGRERAFIGINTEAQEPMIRMNDTNGNTKLQIYALSSGQVGLMFWGSDAKPKTMLAVSEDRAAFFKMGKDMESGFSFIWNDDRPIFHLSDSVGSKSSLQLQISKIGRLMHFRDRDGGTRLSLGQVHEQGPEIDFFGSGGRVEKRIVPYLP